jgi:hypothetical protein
MSDRRKPDLSGIYVYSFGLVVCLYFLFDAWVHGPREMNVLPNYSIAGPIFVLFSVRLYILGRKAIKGYKGP